MPSHPSIVFTGSSIIALWENLASFFPGERVINTAISGSQTADLLPRLGELVLDHQPELVCYYCGSNDINNGVIPVQIAANVARSFALLSEQQPGLQFIYLSIIRAPQKAPLMREVVETNQRMAGMAEEVPNFHFIDINPVFFSDHGEPRLDFYLEDGLHHTAEAYAALGQYLGPRVLDLMDRNGQVGL